MVEVKTIIRREERERLQREFELQEREKKMGDIWHRIKKRREETKIEVEVAFKRTQAPMKSLDHRTMTIVHNVIMAGAKWWDARVRRKYDKIVKQRVVLVDVKVSSRRRRPNKCLISCWNPSISHHTDLWLCRRTSSNV